MLDRQRFENSRPDGFAVLEVVDPEPHGGQQRRFVPLRRSELAGRVTGPLADLQLTQVFAYSRIQYPQAIEALYRFPLPGDAAVTAVQVTFGDVEIRTELQEREQAEQTYEAARAEGRQAALATRESPDVFTLRVTGIQPEQEVRVVTSYVQLARPEGPGWTLRIPLTTAPRYVREDERGSRHAAGQPLAVLRDPGHRFSLQLEITGEARVRSATHRLEVTPTGDGQTVALLGGEVLPDRDCVLAWTPEQDTARSSSQIAWYRDSQDGHLYFLALVAPPSAPPVRLSREVVLLVDRSGSMGGAKWTAADWAVNSFLSGLSDQDSFALGLFHDSAHWLAKNVCLADARNGERAVQFLASRNDSGGTNLGVALEQALGIGAAPGAQSRHVLIVTDAEVSDSGRILRLVDDEAKRSQRRRVSVLCIDAAPNSLLAHELAERGGGVARFLTSSPEEEDITTALEETLEEWAAPVNTQVRLEIDRPGVEVAGRQVVVQNGQSVIDLGDLPAARSLWVMGRLPHSEGQPLAFRLTSAQGELASGTYQPASTESNPALKALFGARKVLALEFLSTSYMDDAEVWEQLERLGYLPEHLGTVRPGKPRSVYAENTRAALVEALRALLAREALCYGLASAETAFVAVRSEAGTRVTETVVVANALPNGWSDGFIASAGAPGAYSMGAIAAMPMSAPPPAPAASPQRLSLSKIMKKKASPSMARVADMGLARTPAGPAALRLWSGVPHFDGLEALHFDRSAPGPLPEAGTLSEIQVRLENAPGSSDMDPELTLLLYVDDPAVPRARIRLSDLLRQGGKRPLNLRFRQGELVRVVLTDPNGAWGARSLDVSVVCS